jgi:signal transduction histidine kinase
VTGDDTRGSGLGLAIARQLVVSHGGEIAAESVPGEGTAILVRLPLTGD